VMLRVIACHTRRTVSSITGINNQIFWPKNCRAHLYLETTTQTSHLGFRTGMGIPAVFGLRVPRLRVRFLISIPGW
jgi:hypothetical protein